MFFFRRGKHACKTNASAYQHETPRVFIHTTQTTNSLLFFFRRQPFIFPTKLTHALLHQGCTIITSQFQPRRVGVRFLLVHTTRPPIVLSRVLVVWNRHRLDLPVPGELYEDIVVDTIARRRSVDPHKILKHTLPKGESLESLDAFVTHA